MIVFEYFCEKIENFREADQNVVVPPQEYVHCKNRRIIISVAFCN